MTEDQIRALLRSVAVSPFIWTPPGHVAIMRSRVVDAGGDPDAVGAWVEAHGGSIERTSPVTPRTRQRAYSPRPASEYFYAVPAELIGRDAESG